MSSGDQPAVLWRRSQACNPVECVEVAFRRDRVLVRDSTSLGRPFWSSRGMNGTRSLLACNGGASLAASSGMLVWVSGLVAQVISGVHAWGRDPMVLLGQDSRRVWEGDLDGEDRHG